LIFARVRRQFTAERDAAGVPHIVAGTWLDALYGLGYLHAIDRSTQILFSRSIASGRAAEQIADRPELVETDRFFRKASLTRGLTEEARALDDYTFSQLTAYCEGVNDGLAEGGRTWPMWATGFVPDAWNQEAILLVGLLLAYGGLAISQIQGERLLLEMIHAGVSEPGLKELFAPHLYEVDFAMLRDLKLSSQLSDEALELLTDLPRLAGSNAWAVSPQRSATGSALLAADPHLEINRLPAIWYEAVLRWGDEYVMGATLPGCPLFAVARTRHVSWGVTYLKADTIDYFIEDCRPGGASGWEYRRGNAWHEFRRRDELILRKGAPAETLKVYENDQGTLDCDPDTIGAGHHLTTRWSGSEPGSGLSIRSWLDLVGAPDVEQAMKVVRPCPQPSLCWVFADREGNIGQQSAGRIPLRAPGHTGLTPVPAWIEANHWRGWLSTSDLPSHYNPPEGFVATANESQNRPYGPVITPQVVADYRHRRIRERLAELPQATLGDMQALQYDVVSLQARDLLELFLPCLEDSELKTRLQNWSCDYSPHSQEATLFLRLYRQVLVEVFGHAHGFGWRRMVYLVTRAGYSLMVLTAADRLLLQDDSWWWAGRDKCLLIRNAAQRIDMARNQPWSQINYFHFTDRFFGGLQLGRWLGFESATIPMPGNHATPFQGHVLQTATRVSTFAPSYHFVTDMATDEAWTNLPGGPGESRFSGLYNTDVARWQTGEYKRLG
ncbi:MAG TPA: penicillin acylase family protein, partial [Pirellulaceae bacterium]|nr:penicillin acylase family protein [Pirellulaceae bacterium]